jgi:hypothetical protein
MTNEQEDDRIHDIVALLKQYPNGYALDDYKSTLGISNYDIQPLTRRLFDEGLISKSVASFITPTSRGLTVGRSEGGYRADLRKRRRKELVQEIKDWLGVSGSILGGVAGMAGLGFSFYSLWLNNRDTDKSDRVYEQLNARVNTLTQEDTALRVQLATLQQALAHKVDRATATQTSPTITSTKPARAPTPTPTK